MPRMSRPSASRAAARARNELIDAVSLMIPKSPSGGPRDLRSQVSVTVSSSVSEGDVFHTMPFALIAAVSSSARMPACDPVIEKYAKNAG